MNANPILPIPIRPCFDIQLDFVDVSRQCFPSHKASLLPNSTPGFNLCQVNLDFTLSTYFNHIHEFIYF